VATLLKTLNNFFWLKEFSNKNRNTVVLNAPGEI